MGKGRIPHTGARIGAKTANGMFRSIYLHYDGDDRCLATLNNHYLDKEKVAQLLDLGDLMCLGPEIGHKVTNTERANMGLAVLSKEQCIAYARDKNESGCGSKHSETFHGMVMQAKEYGAEWLYVYVDGVWDQYDLTAETIKEIKHAAKPDPFNPCIRTGAYVFLPQYQLYAPADIFKIGTAILVRFPRDFMRKGRSEPQRTHTHILTIPSNGYIQKTDGYVMVPEHCLQEVQELETA
jgi:hypothetical protein